MVREADPAPLAADPQRMTTLALAPSRTPTAWRILFSLLQRIDRGRLTVALPDRTVHAFGRGGGCEAALDVRDARTAGAVVKRGDIGFAEAYMRGMWDSPDLPALLTLLAENQPALTGAFYGRPWVRTLMRLRHLLRGNSRRQAKRNIVAHYDLGNDFYAAWLDPGMTYSSALFDGDPGRSLADAQQAKYDRVLGELGLQAPAHVLEIGCGWGGFAETAARAGHRVTGISLSDAQTAYASRRMHEAAVADRVSLRLLDYRDVRGEYDGIASIEMFEAVGERYWPAYFRAIRQSLVPGGRACIQAITIDEDRFERYRTQSDFIQQYIFPGGMLASRSRLVAEAGRQGLTLVDVHAFGQDYTRTLVHWLSAFDAAAPALRARGFDDTFIRCWRFYLAYCAAGFAASTTDVAHYTFVRG
jgi:cyclopropane-fatty-acyl-phospholipid synthase